MLLDIRHILFKMVLHRKKSKIPDKVLPSGRHYMSNII